MLITVGNTTICHVIILLIIIHFTFVASSLCLVCSAIKFTHAHDLCNCCEQFE